MAELDRRTMLTASAAAVAALTPSLAGAQAVQGSGQAAVAGSFAPVPLSFDPTTIAGLSERLLRSHYDNNYQGAVRRLGQIRGTFAALDPANAPGFHLNGLKREELIAWNSMILHEIYFAGFGTANAPAPPLAHQMERDFGSHDRWLAEFSAMGRALSGGSGWVLLNWSARDRRLVNSWAADHSMTIAGATPLLALDMYEHAYAMDYGANAGGYVTAYMAAIDWTAASRSFADIIR
jgi:superoxide dismutase, Fe-Mn family